jgi:hypothetical protein
MKIILFEQFFFNFLFDLQSGGEAGFEPAKAFIKLTAKRFGLPAACAALAEG